jgi:hypothetical protein
MTAPRTVRITLAACALALWCATALPMSARAADGVDEDALAACLALGQGEQACAALSLALDHEDCLARGLLYCMENGGDAACADMRAVCDAMYREGWRREKPFAGEGGDSS